MSAVGVGGSRWCGAKVGGVAIAIKNKECTLADAPTLML